MKLGKNLVCMLLCVLTILPMGVSVSASGLKTENGKAITVNTPEGVKLEVNPFLYYYGLNIPCSSPYRWDIEYEEGYNSNNIVIEKADKYQFYEFPSGKHKGKRFCLNNGKLVTGLAVINDKIYCFQPDGIQIKSAWVTNENGDKFYIGDKGVALKGWYKINGYRYYFKPNGVMATGVVKINDKIYCFNSKGRQQFDKFYTSNSGNTYYVDSDGYVATGWKKIDGNHYYFDSHGVMATGVAEVDGYWIKFSKSGEYIGQANGDWGSDIPDITY